MTDSVPVRLTSQVALQVIREAAHSLLIVSFAAHGVTEVVRALAAAADRGVRVDLVLESSVDDGGTLTGRGGADAFSDLRARPGVRFWEWPEARRGTAGGSRPALHAKLIAADETVVLLGSANLTDRALEHNLEVGVVLREPPIVRAIVRHFHALMRPSTGALKPLP
jgi:phosphatidylserine/phosphatidylglycerophosphate/cardiolipin synthase-like enzyme